MAASPRGQRNKRAAASSAGVRRPARGGVSSRKPSRASKAPSRLSSAGERAAGLLDKIGAMRVPLAITAIVLVVLASLYFPAQDLYCAWREQGSKQATLEQLNESIDEYQGDIDRLQTREGIEDEARKRGYVEDGEVGVTAVGLPEDEQTDDEDQELPWYLALGDFVFQYREEQ